METAFFGAVLVKDGVCCFSSSFFCFFIYKKHILNSDKLKNKCNLKFLYKKYNLYKKQWLLFNNA